MNHLRDDLGLDHIRAALTTTRNTGSAGHLFPLLGHLYLAITSRFRRF
jgi:hypothetical protein